ncbi:MAG TPA: hypothetical protein VJI98_05655 [Candidatus Nanoarchaeia archaeon]|nr:hypothetical protein [Candidatus Nanoarchaeia archaeon]
MVDLTPTTIRKLFERQIRELTSKTIPIEESFNIQFNGGWVR